MAPRPLRQRPAQEADGGDPSTTSTSASSSTCRAPACSLPEPAEPVLARSRGRHLPAINPWVAADDYGRVLTEDRDAPDIGR
jgi:hypothetical protein